MHEFGSVKECPKCGNDSQDWLGARRDWQPEHRHWIGLFRDPKDRKIPECLKITCGICGYTWYEKPKDAPNDS